MEEDRLIQALIDRRPDAFRELVRAYQNQIYNTCLGFVYRKVEAEDLTQEVFMEIHRSIHAFKGKSRLGTWIYQIAVRKSLEHIRRQKRQKRMAFFKARDSGEEVLQYAQDVTAHPGIQLENQERGRILFQAIKRLPDKQQTVFTLCKVEGMSYQEVSEIMKISLSSVESLMFRARKKLQSLLREYYRQA